jgi:hypothetical protein
MSGLNIPIGGDLAPFLAVAADLRREMGRMGKSVRSSTKSASSSARAASSGFRFLRSVGVASFRAIANAARGTMSVIRRVGGIMRSLIPGGAILGLAGLVGGFLSVRSAIRGFKEALALGGALSDLSARTGAGVKDLVILQEAFKQSGIDAGQVGPAINRLQKALAGVNEDGQDTSSIFAKLGLDIRQLRKMNPTQQFDAIGKAIAAIPDPAERAAAAMAIFGRAGGELITLFKDGGAIDSAASNLGLQAALLQKNAALFDRISDILGSAGNKMRGLFVGIADRLAPVIKPFLEVFDKIDLAAYGQALGDAISQIIPNAQALVGLIDKAKSLGKIIGDGILAGLVLIRDGKTFELLKTGIEAAMAVGIDLLMRGLKSAVAFLAAALPPIMGMVFSKLSDPLFWEGVGQILKGIGKAIGAEISAALPGGLATEGQRQKNKNDRTMAEMMMNTGKTFIGESGGGESLAEVLTDSLMKGGSAAADAFGEMGGSAKESVGKFKDLISTAQQAVAEIKSKTGVDETDATPSEITAAAPGTAAVAKPAFGPLTTSLGRIGGGGFGMSFTPMVSQQQQTNKHLADISRKITPSTGGASPVIA